MLNICNIDLFAEYDKNWIKVVSKIWLSWVSFHFLWRYLLAENCMFLRVLLIPSRNKGPCIRLTRSPLSSWGCEPCFIKKNYIIPLSSSYFNLLFALCHFLKVFYTLFINSNCLFYTILTSFDMHRHYIILSKKWNIQFDKWVCPKIITAGTLGFILSRGRDNFYYISCACIKRTGQLEGEMVDMLLCDISIGSLTCQLLFSTLKSYNVKSVAGRSQDFNTFAEGGNNRVNLENCQQNTK